MDKDKNRRMPVFTYGLIIGLLVGVLLSLGFIIGFYFQSKTNDDSSIDDVKVYKPVSKNKKSKTKNITDSKNLDSQISNDSLLKYDENGNPINDSIHAEEGGNYSMDVENIRVAQEQLLFVRNIIPSGNKSNFYCQTKEMDSLLVDNPPLNKDGKFRVEFWASPVNFVGYKLSTNRLILYGFIQFQDVNLEYNPAGGLKMKYLNNEYKLNCTDDFVALYIRKNK